jgi:hypothetical protein
MSPLILKVCNIVAFALNIVFNKVGNSGNGGKAIRAVAETYDHVALPKGAAFAIWGIIYLWELIFLVSQFLITDYDEGLERATLWFCLGQLMQGTWVMIFTKTDCSLAATGGDFWFWSSTILLIATPAAFLQMVAWCSSLSGAAYWCAFGITVNAAWVLLAAGLSVNQAARALGWQGTALSATAIVVLSGTVVLEFWITGLIGSNPFHTPLAFFPVATWALLWIVSNLKDVAPEPSDHAKRILPLYGSTFINIYKCIAIALAVAFLGLEVMLCMR